MQSTSQGHRPGSQCRRRLLPLVAILLLAGALVVTGWLVLSGRAPNAGEVARPGTPWATPATPTAVPTLPYTPTWTTAPTGTSGPTPSPTVSRPTIVDLRAEADDAARTVTFYLGAAVPPARQIAEVLLWYDTEAGRRVRRMPGPLHETITTAYTLDAAQEGLTRTLTTTRELDYWWLVRDTAGESVRAGGGVELGPALQALVVPPAAELPVDFAWAVSDTVHFRLYYAPDSAAERDRAQIGAVAEAALAQVSAALDVELSEPIRVYLVPRVFWQGAATYADKTLLISYLDRNYAGVDLFSYFAHEATHALAQDLLQPKEDGGGPDGVLVEGLAVWATGGHYGPEPIDEWAAVVATSDDYIPLAELRAGPFYDFQHEISYLEGASFVKYLVGRYGLQTLKELYGRATGQSDQDEALVLRLYGKGYADLEEEWLAYLETRSPTPEQAAAWHLQVRYFDLMRRYETKLDPTARILPGEAPPDWKVDTLQLFLTPVRGPLHVALETALIAAQERAQGTGRFGQDLEGAAALLDDVEAALDAGGRLDGPGLRARQEILELMAVQERALLRADVEAYLGTLEPGYAARPGILEQLQLPFTAYGQEVVRLDLAADGRSAQGVVVVRSRLLDQEAAAGGQLVAVSWIQQSGRWLVSGREAAAMNLP